MTQTASAFARVEGALTFFVNYYTSLADFRAVSDRLSSFDASIFRAREASAHGPRRTTGTEGIAMEDVTVALPDGRRIMHDADLRLTPGESVLLSGPSGSGKSTLAARRCGPVALRRGHHRRAGRRVRHGRAAEALHSARHSCARPSPIPIRPTGTAMRKSSTRCARPGSRASIDQIDTEDLWSQRLSGGEQQRLAIARVLLAKPDWLFPRRIDRGDGRDA